MLPSFIFLVKDQFKRAARYPCHSESSLISLAFSFISLATLLHMLPPPQPIFTASNLFGGINSFCSLCCSYLSLTSLGKSWCIHFYLLIYLLALSHPFWISTVGFSPPLDLSKLFVKRLLVFFFFFIQGILDLCGLTVIGKLCALACSTIRVS